LPLHGRERLDSLVCETTLLLAGTTEKNMIDTLKFARHMQTKGGMTQEAAEALAECINEGASIDQLATKEDLAIAVSGLRIQVWSAAVAIGLATCIFLQIWK